MARTVTAVSAPFAIEMPQKSAPMALRAVGAALTMWRHEPVRFADPYHRGLCGGKPPPLPELPSDPQRACSLCNVCPGLSGLDGDRPSRPVAGDRSDCVERLLRRCRGFHDRQLFSAGPDRHAPN